MTLMGAAKRRTFCTQDLILDFNLCRIFFTIAYNSCTDLTRKKSFKNFKYLLVKSGKFFNDLFLYFYKDFSRFSLGFLQENSPYAIVKYLVQVMGSGQPKNLLQLKVILLNPKTRFKILVLKVNVYSKLNVSFI
jgi:hypothetical protein